MSSPWKILPNAPPFYEELHIKYIKNLAETHDSTFEGALTEHLKISGVYWSLTALSLILSPSEVDEALQLQSNLVDFVFECFDEKTGGFAGNVGQDGHLLYTLSALQVLAIAQKLDDDRLNREAVIEYCVSREQDDGSFTGDEWGEVDTRFVFCALSSLALLGALDRVNSRRSAEYIMSCQNVDGGFGAVKGGESHAGQVFCCVGVLAISKSMGLLESSIDTLGWWLSERQVDSGGLNGRSEKQADVCYSWWIVSALSVIGRMDWISKDRLASFILKCQDGDDGGIADRPDDMADVFHTFFGVAGLSLLGHLHDQNTSDRRFRMIDPVYALPSDIVQSLALPGQVIKPPTGVLDPRLRDYDLLGGQ